MVPQELPHQKAAAEIFEAIRKEHGESDMRLFHGKDPLQSTVVGNATIARFLKKRLQEIADSHGARLTGTFSDNFVNIALAPKTKQ